MALNPHQKNKVDISSLTEEEQKLFRLYGKLPNKKDLFNKVTKERKFFDSGDYAMSKAGKSDSGTLGGGLGREHPTPENIPHLSQMQTVGSPSANSTGNSTSPVNSNHHESRNSISGGLPTLHPTTNATGASALAVSPTKEPSVLQRGISVDEADDDEAAQK